MDSREGSITYGGTELRIRLAERPGKGPAYRPVSRVAWSDREDVSGGDPLESSGTPMIRRWVIRSFEKGETRELWRPGGGYYRSAGVRPNRDGDKLIVGLEALDTVTDAAAATFLEGRKLCRAHGLLWAALDASAHWWQTSTSDWDATGWATGGGANTVTSMCDWGDGATLAIGYSDKTIRKVASGANSTHFAAGGATYNPELAYRQGVVYYLDGANLFSLDLTVADTRTQLSAPGTRVAAYMASAGNLYRRMTVTDTGVAWLVPGDDGAVYIWEYNIDSATDYPTGKLPVEQCFPYSIHYAHGYLFVGYRYAAAHDQEGEAYIYYQRGGQWGNAGPIRPETAMASDSVLIGGMIGDDLIFMVTGAGLFGYDLSEGAVYQIANTATTTTTDLRTYGRDVFAPNSTANHVTRYFTGTTAQTGLTWRSGRHNFDLPGIKKVLYRVTVVTDGLPANTSVALAVSADGASFSTVTGTHDTDDATVYSWTVSSSSSQVTGYDFELQLTLTGTTTSTPEIREIICEAGPAQKRRGVELDVDLGATGRSGGFSATQVLSQLRAASEYTGGVVSLSDPWGVAETEAPRTSDVMVEVVAGLGFKEVATVRMWEIALV